MIWFRDSAGDPWRSHALDVTVCDTFLKRLFGALPRGRIPPSEALLLPRCRHVHTFFMRSAISLLFFDASGTVVQYHPRVRPWSSRWGNRSVIATLEAAPERFDPPPRPGSTELRMSPSVLELAELDAELSGERLQPSDPI